MTSDGKDPENLGLACPSEQCCAKPGGQLDPLRMSEYRKERRRKGKCETVIRSTGGKIRQWGSSFALATPPLQCPVC
jgi:hypothetical protein